MAQFIHAFQCLDNVSVKAAHGRFIVYEAGAAGKFYMIADVVDV